MTCTRYVVGADKLVHPSIFYRLFGVGSRGQQPEQGSPNLRITSSLVVSVFIEMEIKNQMQFSNCIHFHLEVMIAFVVISG